MNDLLKRASIKEMLEARIRLELEKDIIVHDNLEAQINAIVRELSLISVGSTCFTGLQTGGRDM